MIEFLEILRSDPRNFLWSIHVKAELFGAIRKVWPILNEESRAELCNMILEGPPRDMLPMGSEIEWVDFVDRKIWERLARIAQVDPEFSGPAADRLHELENANSEWRLEGSDREDAAIWFETYSGASPRAREVADELLALSDREIAERIRQDIEIERESRIYRGYFIQEVWDSIVEKNRNKALEILRIFWQQQFLHESTWSRGLWAFSSISIEDESSMELLNLIRNFSIEFLERDEIINVVTSILKSMTNSMSGEQIESNMRIFLDFWDWIFPYAIKVSSSVIDEESLGIFTYAINHPLGRISEILFDFFPVGDISRGSGISRSLQIRLERILESYELNMPGWPSGYVIIASRLSLLHYLDAEWVKKIIFPAFDWSNREKAKMSWNGYLVNPRVDPDLLEMIKESFFQIFDFEENLPQNAYDLFADIVISSPNSISHDQSRSCLQKMSAQGRKNVLRFFSNSLERAGSKSSTLWKDRIGSWINDVWPRDRNFHSYEQAFWFAQMVIATGESFSEALQVSEQFLLSLNEMEAGHILRKMSEENSTNQEIIKNHPRDLLKFLDKVCPNVPNWRKNDLQKLLDQVKDVDLAIEEDPHYRRLWERTL